MRQDEFPIHDPMAKGAFVTTLEVFAPKVLDSTVNGPDYLEGFFGVWNS